MLEIIDGLVATVTVVLVLSLIVQAIQQIIKQFLSMKSKYMERELFAMFQQVSDQVPSWLHRVGKSFRNLLLPAVLELWLDKQKDPHAKKVIDLIRIKLMALGYNDLALLEGTSKQEFLKLLAVLSSDPDTKQLIEDAKADVEKWYDLTMKAFQDHYERRMKIWSYVLSGLVVIWLNANLFEIYKEFSTNKVLRDAAIQMGAQLTSIPRDSLVGVSKGVNKDSVKVIVDSLAFKAIQRNIAQIDSLVHIKSFQIMRWDSARGAPMHFRDTCGVAPALALRDFIAGTKSNWPGWLAMTLLVGLGAPFWYDFLKAVMGLKEKLKESKKDV